MAIALRQASESEQGRLQGALGSLQGIAMMVSPTRALAVFRGRDSARGNRMREFPSRFVRSCCVSRELLAARQRDSYGVVRLSELTRAQVPPYHSYP